jgi:glycosyltransferase involved in cell wall biosynthesis
MPPGKPNMRILFLTEERISFSEPLVRGGAIHVRNVVTGLRERGHETFLVDWNETPEKPFQSSVTPRRRFVDGALRTAWHAVKVGRGGDVDVIVSKTRKTYLPGLLAARMLDVPHVVHVGSSLDRPVAGPLDRADMTSFVARLRAPHDGYFVVCDHIAGQLRDRGIDSGKIFDVKNAVDTDRFHPTNVPQSLDDLFRRRLPENEGNRLKLGFVGGLQPYKGLDDLAAAVERCDAHTSVIIAGNGSERGRLETTFDDIGCFLGAVPYEQIPAMYHEMDVLVLPSHTEGLPRVVLEAQATETPVIATSVGGVPEVVTDGETGLLCETRKPAQLSDAFERLANEEELRRRLASNGREQVVAAYSGDELYERYERNIETVLARR